MTDDAMTEGGYGYRMAEYVGELCKQRKHNTDNDYSQPTICGRCWEIMQAIRAKYRQDHPVPPAVLVHIAVDVENGRMRAYLDEADAIALAREHHGVVMTWPVSSDHRPKPEPAWTESVQESLRQRALQHGETSEQENTDG